MSFSNFLRMSLFTALLLAIPQTTLFGQDQAEPRNKLPRKQHKSSNAPFLTPEQAVEKMAIPEGFEVSIFASEPAIGEPIAFCFDDRGRLWVVENYNYRTRRNH
ncbi:MAG: hypothetical protein VX034_05130, partial [Planctomycetota bacterium]|nr:hypothetical protein [Planctomycetota bacterium]